MLKYASISLNQESFMLQGALRHHENTEFRWVAPGCTQSTVKKIEEQRLHNLSGQPVLMLNYPQVIFLSLSFYPFGISPSSLYDFCLSSSSQAPQAKSFLHAISADCIYTLNYGKMIARSQQLIAMAVQLGNIQVDRESWRYSFCCISFLFLSQLYRRLVKL